MAAIAGIVGAILGATITAIPTLVASTNQIDADSARSRAEFQREQERDSYIEFIADEQAFANAAGRLEAVVLAGPSSSYLPPTAAPKNYLPPPPVDELPTMLDDANKTLEKLLQDSARVAVVGSEGEAQIAAQIATIQRKRHIGLQLAVRHVMRTRERLEVEELDRDGDELDKLRASFRQEARAIVGPK